MLVAIKYCGGCNPYYDRSALVQRLKQELSHEVEFAPPGTVDCDVGVIISGCVRRCILQNVFRAKYGSVYVTKDEDFHQTVSFIRQAKEKWQADHPTE
ncbi:MAG: hypothetical protein ACOYI4_01505 [Christensenellales bacterium]|jgi:hypothetical protein